MRGDDVIGGYMGLEGVTGHFRGHRCYMGFQGFGGSQRVIGGYNVFFIEIIDVSVFASKRFHGFTRGCRGLQRLHFIELN